MSHRGGRGGGRGGSRVRGSGQRGGRGRGGAKHARDEESLDVQLQDEQLAHADKRRRSNAVGRGLYDESDAPDVQAAAQIEKQSADRLFWEQFDTPLLRSWMLDYPQHKDVLRVADQNNREVLIATLVQHGKRPAARSQATQLAALQKVFLQSSGRAAADNSPLPGLFRAGEKQVTVDDTSSEPDEHEEKYPSQSQLQLEQRTGPGTTLPGQNQTRSHSPTTYSCLTCLVEPSREVKAGKWICECGRRGDLPGEHPVNEGLTKEKLIKLEKAAAAPGASLSSGSSSTGQSSFTATPKLTLRDAHLKELFDTNAHTPNPKFAAGRTLSAADALAAARDISGAAMCDPPSAQLIALIQSGFLKKPGFALPLSSSRDTSKDASATTLEFDDQGRAKSKTNDVTVATELKDFNHFCSALLNTILPALIDRPVAMMEWISLAANALFWTGSSDGWPAARAYIHMMLSEQVSSRQSFAVTTDRVNRAMHESAAAGSFRQAGGARSAGSGKQLSCNPWNAGAPGMQCSRANCEFAHHCALCSSTQHARGSCPRNRGGGQSAPSLAESSRGGRNGGGRRGHAFGGGAKSADRTFPEPPASVTTMPAAK